MTEPIPKSPEIDLSFLLNQASYALAARLGTALAEVGLTVREYCVLAKAVEQERTQIEIAQLAGLDKTTMVIALDELERAGYAERRISERDRRARVIAVTPSGRRVLGRAYGVVNSVVKEVLGHLDPGRRVDLVEGLKTLTDGVLAEPSHVAPQRRKQVRPGG
jgi:DNA-binding MarR family transcriptional regulator